MNHFEPAVFIVDDDPAICKSLRWLLISEGIRVEAYDSAEEFLEAYTPPRPGCLILDVQMAGMNGLELQETLNARKIYIPIVFITGHGDIPKAVKAIKHGAVDFIEKPFDDSLLIERIHQALAIARQYRTKQHELAGIEERLGRLTPREREVMDLLITRRANKVVATQLGLSVKTVDIHRAHIMHKLEAESLAEIVHLQATYRALLKDMRIPGVASN